MSIPPRFLDELRARITLSDVIRKSVRLTRAGREFKGCCPFHNEKSPSFYVNDDKQFYHCFGCGAHGSVIDYVMRHDNYSFPEAVEALASSIGMQVPQSAPEDIEKAKKEKSLYTMLDEAARWMEQQLRRPESKVAYDYLIERGVNDETIQAFRIGFAPNDMQSLRKHIAAQGYTDAQMIEGGLLKTSEKAREPYAFFRDRIMFPVPDRRGRIVAYGGRILPDHLRAPDRGDFKPPKYINSSDTPLFHKGSMLYGEPHARQAAADGLPIIVVEGYLDVIAAFRAGFKGAVAPLGTALTEEQIGVLWKMIPSDSKIPILCFDGDNAGRRAASRACERILPMLKPDHSAKIAFLPDGEDPDSLVKKRGKGALQAVLDEALDLVDFVWMDYTAGKNLDTPEARAGLSKTLDDVCLRITDRTVQHYYKEAFKVKVREAFAAPVRDNGWTPRRNGGNWQKNAPPPPVTDLRRPKFAKNMLGSVAFLTCLINNPAIFHEVEEDVGHMHLPENKLDHVRQHVLSTLALDPDLDADGLKTHLLEHGFEPELRLLLSESVYTHASFAREAAEVELALVGWKAAWAKMQEAKAQEELDQAILAWKQDPSDENEIRVRELRKMRRISEG